MARRDDGAYWAYVTEEQRRQPGCPARELCESSRFQGTRIAQSNSGTVPMTGPDRRPDKRVTLSRTSGVAVEFVIDEQPIRSPVLDLSEEDLLVEYPATAPALR